jgi:hypothetical protein
MSELEESLLVDTIITHHFQASDKDWYYEKGGMLVGNVLHIHPNLLERAMKLYPSAEIVNK